MNWAAAGSPAANYSWHKCLSLVALVLISLRTAPQSSHAFAPSHHIIRSLHSGCNEFPSYYGRSVDRRSYYSFLSAKSRQYTSLESSPDAYAELDTEDQTSQTKKDLSYAAILKAVDEGHYNEAIQLCSYLATETITSGVGDRIFQDDDKMNSYHSPATPVLSEEAVNALRMAAQNYFENMRENNNDGGWGIETVALDELVSAEAGVDLGWKKGLDDALTQHIYPLVRSGWPTHDAFTPSSSKAEGEDEPPLLTVTSATIFAGCGYPGAKVAMTTLERDAGLFLVHIDLGNERDIEKVLSGGGSDENPAMGALYLESLVAGRDMRSSDSIVGPLTPGQMVVHKSIERSAAIVVPSDIHSVEQKDTGTLDSPLRGQIAKAAESARHYALRLVLTTRTGVGMETTDGSPQLDIPDTPSEERSYRLRSFARFSDSRVRYLTLAGLIDVNDYENHLWIGYDYISRVDNPDFEVLQQLSFANKAVFHLEKAAALCPTDARVHFQIATAIKAKMDCEKRLIMEGANDRDEIFTGLESADEMVDLARVADALERSAQFESTAVKLGVNGINDLAICLNALVDARCKMGEFEKALDAMDQYAECGSIRSKLASEDFSDQLRSIPNYEWIRNVDGRNVAVRTVGQVRVFEPDDIALLRAAADKRFALADGVQTSRYSMQYEGNSETHLDDLCTDPILKVRIDQILQEKVYPLVRAAFSEDGSSEGDEPPLGSLCVYDSIFVRYNGDIAKAAGLIGASQPLHQDGGIYSVNIALNDHKDDDDNGFTGGGTFLEALTVGDDEHIQRPTAPGHAILHKTTQRHAGAPTTSGVRDILVIFLSARRPEAPESDENTWRIERAMRLLPIAKELPREKLIHCMNLAKSNDPTNSELPYWLGVHLMQGEMNDPSDERWAEICEGVESLKLATFLNPADARAHYHLGMSISTRHKYAMRTRRANFLPPPKEAADSLVHAFETAIGLERKCVEAGCDNGINLAAAFLSLGDFMARLKDFDKAIVYLDQVEDTIRKSGDFDKDWAQSYLQEVVPMLDYCKKESEERKVKKSLVK